MCSGNWTPILCKDNADWVISLAQIQDKFLFTQDSKTINFAFNLIVPIYYFACICVAYELRGQRNDQCQFGILKLFIFSNWKQTSDSQ